MAAARAGSTTRAAGCRPAFGDDMMLGIEARALGLALRDLHAVFGLKHVGLADTPQGLADRGFAIVHSRQERPGARRGRDPRLLRRAKARMKRLLGVNAVDHPGGAEIGLLRLSRGSRPVGGTSR